MVDHIVSIDAGNGGTNGVLARATGYKSVYFPSVRAVATGDSLGLGSQFEIQYEYVDWGQHRYVVGDDVVHVSRRGIERHQGAFRYGDEFHEFLVTVALARLGVSSGTVDLTLFAPPGMYANAKEAIEQRFWNNGGKTRIKLKSDVEERSWTYEKITVWPEGIGAAACFVVDDEGRMIPDNDVLSGQTVVLDMGMHTLDALQMSDGNFNPESLATATWENGGLKVHLLEPILRQVKKADDDFALLTLDDIDEVIRNAVIKQDYKLRVAGKEIELKEAIEKYAERYSEWVANNIIDGVFNGLRGFKSAILVGGGARLTAPHLAKWYPNKLLRFDENEATKDIDPVDANAVGGIRLAKMRLNQPELK
jgi:hypothetical protein